MSNLQQFRFAAREIFGESLQAVDASEAVRRAVRFRESRLSVCDRTIPNRRIYAVALGKAAYAMAYALDKELANSLVAGVLAGPRITLSPAQQQWLSESRWRWRWYAGGHPLANKRSLDAAYGTLALLERADQEHALVIFLISGGGSAMMEWPIKGDITLENIRVANKILIASGASIGGINAVRRTFSLIKGGRLAAKAPNCDQVTLIVSDVPSGEEWNVASGPTLPPPADAPEAREVVARYGLRERLPAPILQAIDSEEVIQGPSASSPKLHEHFVLIDNNRALEAAVTAAERRAFRAEIARDISDEPIEVGCEKLMRRAISLRESNIENVCLISGGEFACPVQGDGIGGRNLETALRLAIAAEKDRERTGEFVALCAGTDGIDGNSQLAGAIIDSTTIERARGLGLDPMHSLSHSDSGPFFEALGDAIDIGPTGTNVRDLRILLA